MNMNAKTAKTWGWAAALAVAFTLAQAQEGGFRFRGLLTRVITPNGDGLNDEAIFCLDNPSGSAVDGRVYTLLGTEVARMSPAVAAAGTACPQDSVVTSGPQLVRWDGRSGGQSVTSGIYVYAIKSEGLNVTGTLVVVR